MKNRVIILTAALLFAMSLSAHAQIGGILDRARQVADAIDNVAGGNQQTQQPTNTQSTQPQPTLDKLTFVKGGNQYRVRAANNSISGDVVIPATYEGLPVVATDYSGGMFKNITGITSLTILSTQQFTINTGTFQGCTGLTTVSLPEDVSLSPDIFRDCTNLTSVTFRGGTRITYSTSFPGDLQAKFNARSGGGPGVYTRQRGSDTWTRTGDAPAPVVTINTSLDGVWENQSGQQVTVSGSTGVRTRMPSTPVPLISDAISKGFIKGIGDQNWRNIRSTGNLTWSVEILGIDFDRARPNIATGASYRSFTITMSADGRTLTDNSGTTYTRR